MFLFFRLILGLPFFLGVLAIYSVSLNQPLLDLWLPGFFNICPGEIARLSCEWSPNGIVKCSAPCRPIPESWGIANTLNQIDANRK